MLQKRKEKKNQLSERGPFSFCFSLILDEGGKWEGWAEFAYSSPATAGYMQFVRNAHKERLTGSLYRVVYVVRLYAHKKTAYRLSVLVCQHCGPLYHFRASCRNVPRRSGPTVRTQKNSLQAPRTGPSNAFKMASCLPSALVVGTCPAAVARLYRAAHPDSKSGLLPCPSLLNNKGCVF
jgi:hypothetical protein